MSGPPLLRNRPEPYRGHRLSQRTRRPDGHRTKTPGGTFTPFRVSEDIRPERHNGRRFFINLPSDKTIRHESRIITIGDEILIGQIVDTNSAWIAARLNEAGFTVVRKLTVGDDRREIADAVEGAMRTADAVIVTGGLGPTKDDITKQTLAGIFGGEMVRDRETYERNGRILAARGIEYNELNREQATVPSSAEVLQNMHGTAPGMWFTRGGKAVVSLPGVPFEMKELMETEVMPRLAAHFRQSKVVHRTAITYGLAESVLAATIAEWEAALPGYLHLAYLQPFANQTAPLGLRYRRTPGGGGNRTAVRSARTADTGLLHRLR